MDRGEAAAPSRAPLGTQGVDPGAPSVPWAKKTREQRMELMGLSFHPGMRELFQKYDAAAYDKFRCQTCHGEDMEQRAFAMPAALRALSSADPIADGRSRDPRMTEFMVAEVVPRTAELLAAKGEAGQAPVGCPTCHASN